MEQLAVRCLYTDMDGTLVGDDKRISDENSAAIRRFTELGGRFSIATGRSELLARPFLAELPINCPAILYNGAAVYDFEAERFLHRVTLPDEAAQRLVRAAAACYPEVCAEAFVDGIVRLLNPNGVQDHYIAAEHQPFSQAPMESCRSCLKLIFYGEPERLAVVEAEFSRLGLTEEVTLTYSAPYYLEILPKGVSKGTALEWMMGHIGLAREEVAAIGDYWNDETMIRAAGLGAATGNAPDGVRAAAAVTVKDNNHSAVADLINRFLIREIRA